MQRELWLPGILAIGLAASVVVTNAIGSSTGMSQAVLKTAVIDNTNNGLPGIDLGPTLSSVAAYMPDFKVFDDPDEKKAAFFEFLLPIIEEQNARVLNQRDVIISMRTRVNAGHVLTEDEENKLHELAAYYQLELFSPIDNDQLRLMLRHIDVIPPSLVLSQAATESGWGTSSLAKRANNLFGQMCNERHCSVSPEKPVSADQPQMAKFESPQHAVESYFRNLNTNDAYVKMRSIRQKLRENNQAITGLALVEGLSLYSERGKAYVRQIEKMIKHNGLVRLDIDLAQL